MEWSRGKGLLDCFLQIVEFLIERTDRDELGVILTKQVLFLSFFQLIDQIYLFCLINCSNKVTGEGVVLLHLEAEAKENCFKARLICLNQQAPAELAC